MQELGMMSPASGMRRETSAAGLPKAIKGTDAEFKSIIKV
jgi:hypothetical protein